MEALSANDEAVRLFTDYRQWWLQTANIQAMQQRHPVTPHKVTADRLALFAEVVKWCRDQAMDPRLWLYFLFRRRRWAYAPKLERGHLMSPRMVEDYRTMVRRGCLDGYREHVTPKASPVDRNRDVIPRAEAYKKRLCDAGEYDRCMLSTPDVTYGYHPKSKVCPACPKRDECLEQLRRMVGFDILALREGRITSVQARSEVAAR